MQTIIIGCSNSRELAKKISRLLKTEYSELFSAKFPDGELHIRFMTTVKNKKIVLVQTMHPAPNDSIIESVLAIKTAKNLGAKEVVLVSPYLAYLRQDKMFHPGECISNKIISEFLSTADRVITIDPHLHRINKLSEIFSAKTTTLSAMHAVTKHIIENKMQGILIGPDIESSQWASKVAQETGLPFTILHKKRYTARKIRTKVNANVRGKNVIIIDDIISTGHTMLEPIKQLKKSGAKKITCIAVHGLFAENALELLHKTGAEVLSTNTIQTKASKIDVTEIITNALR